MYRYMVFYLCIIDCENILSIDLLSYLCRLVEVYLYFYYITSSHHMSSFIRCVSLWVIVHPSVCAEMQKGVELRSHSVMGRI